MRKKGMRVEPDVVEGARALGEQDPLIQSIEQQHQERMKVQGIPEKMKAVLPRSGVGAAEVRELEGLRKEKTQHLSARGSQETAGEQLPDEIEYSNLEKEHGKGRVDFLREFDSKFFLNRALNKDTDPNQWKNWQEFRKKMIQDWKGVPEGQETPVEKMDIAKGQSNQSKWET